MLFMRSQQAVEIIEILPGLMAMSVLFGTTSMLAVTITFERKGRSFDRLLLAPISLKVMVLAKIIGSVLFGMFNAFVPIIFGAFLSDLSGVNWGFVFIGVLFIAFSSTLVGLVIAVSAKEIFEAQTYSNFFRFPMIFLCGLFFPVSTLPIFLRPLSYALPLTYGVDILHIALVKSGMMSVWLDILILSVFSVLLFYISMRNIQRKWIL
jgi:ABC-2 type transport system permease protein